MKEPYVSVHDASVNVWLENPDSDQPRQIFQAINLLLMDLGFLMGKDKHIEKNYACLGPYHRTGWFFDLHVSLSLRGRYVEAAFFQDKVIDNPHGNKYDFNILSKMPYIMRLQFLKVKNRIIKLCEEQGVPHRMSERDLLSETSTPLERFNAAWMGDRFKRDADGWPAKEELRSWVHRNVGETKEDWEARVPQQGLLKYTIDYRTHRCIAVRIYGGINGMWHGYVGNTFWSNESFGTYRDTPLGRRRYWRSEQAHADVIDKHLIAAINAGNFKKAEAIRRHRANIIKTIPMPKLSKA